MSQKINKKHTVKQSSRQPDLIAAAPGAKPITSPFVTAVQIAAALPFASISDTFLRNLSRAEKPNPRTGSPWIPKPRGGKYDLNATVLGLLEWFHVQAGRAEGLPRVCNSMKHAEELFFLPHELQQYVRSHGGAEAFEASNRVRVLEVLRHAFPLLKKIFSGGAAQIKGVEGMEDLDSDFQLARVRKEDADERARENALANKNLFTRAGIEEELAAPLAAAANAWKNYDKDTGAKLQAYLTTAGLTVEQAKAARAMATAGAEKIPATLREKLKLETKTK